VSDASALSVTHQRIVDRVGAALGGVAGVRAVVLGGSFARGRATAGSDLDIGLLYSEAQPIDTAHLGELAAEWNDPGGEPARVTEPFEWGPWANGGAWLRIEGERVDWIYRSLDQIDRVLADAEAGRYEIHAAQQPPFGFFGPTYLGEVQIAIPLFDPTNLLAPLQARVADYPEALRQAVVDDQLWAVEFGLDAFATKFAARGQVLLTVAALARFAHQLALALFAIHRTHPVNDKTLLDEISQMDSAPPHFARRVESILADPGRERERLMTSVAAFAELHREVCAVAGDLYRRRALPPRQGGRN